MNDRPIFGLSGLAITLAFLAGTSPVFAQSTIATPSMGMMSAPLVTPPIEDLIEVAKNHQKQQHWEEAIQTWLRVIALDRTHTDARANLAKCVRHALQNNRHREARFHERVLAMPQADVLALYDEVLRKVSSNYLDTTKTNMSRLFRQGMDEFMTALDDNNYIEKHVRGTDSGAISKFQANVKRAWAGREVNNSRQAVEVVAEIAAAAKRMLGMRSVNAIVLEFICGACNSLDEYSSYLSDRQIEPEEGDLSQATIELSIQPGNVAYLRILRFDNSTPTEVETTIKNLVAMGTAKALAIDLRGNPGGSFQAAIKTAERFLPAGVIVTAQAAQPENTKVYTSTSGNSATDLPAVLLINGETASAAEVFAVALRENQRAKLVGTATFGKGLLQNLVRFAEEVDDTGKSKPKAGVRLTVARLLSPSGNPITGSGITPDVIERDPERQTDIAMEQARELARRYNPGMGVKP